MQHAASPRTLVVTAQAAELQSIMDRTRIFTALAISCLLPAMRQIAEP